MTLSPPVEREHLHTREVVCEGFKRKDGLWDIEARLSDVKTFGFPNRDRGGWIEAGQPVHDLHVRVTLSLAFEIVDIEALSVQTPFQGCKAVAPNMRRLIGLKIGPGWMRKVKHRVGATAGCTHLTELLGPVATTAYQLMRAELEERAKANPSRARPAIIDTCYALASDGPVVKVQWPEFYTGSDQPEEAE